MRVCKLQVCRSYFVCNEIKQSKSEDFETEIELCLPMFWDRSDFRPVETCCPVRLRTDLKRFVKFLPAAV